MPAFLETVTAPNQPTAKRVPPVIAPPKSRCLVPLSPTLDQTVPPASRLAKGASVAPREKLPSTKCRKRQVAGVRQRGLGPTVDRVVASLQLNRDCWALALPPLPSTAVQVNPERRVRAEKVGVRNGPAVGCVLPSPNFPKNLKKRVAVRIEATGRETKRFAHFALHGRPVDAHAGERLESAEPYITRMSTHSLWPSPPRATGVTHTRRLLS
ncbi:MAG: hypothetical protein Ct9H300mP32_6760 [Verrucomicrobiota bacterium]|nr:MAG: hypothetical protein Ct9H300mP32_6760 [Verrucomicrobiota bacterium]